MKDHKNTNVAFLIENVAELNNITRGEFYDSPFGLCCVYGIHGNKKIIVHVIKTDEYRECWPYDLTCIPLSDDLLTLNGFTVIEADKRYVKYERRGTWQTYDLIFDNLRECYSFTRVGSCIPLRSVDQFQRLLKQVGFCEDLLNSLKIEVE